MHLIDDAGYIMWLIIAADLSLVFFGFIYRGKNLLKITITFFLLSALFKRKSDKATPEVISTVMPKGDFRKFRVSERTICMDKQDILTRLTYFFDEVNQYWFKIETVSLNGTLVGEPRFEAATMTLAEKAKTFL